MEKNVAGKWVVFAFEDEGGTSPGEPVTGNAANITANISIDGAAGSAVGAGANPTELEDGYYVFDLTASETNGDLLTIFPQSATLNVNVIGVPGAVWTTPANFNDLSVTASTGKTTVGTNDDKAGYSISGTKTTLDSLNDVAATDIVSGGAISTTSGSVDSVTTVATTTTNTDMRGTDNALLAASAPTNFGDMAIEATTGIVDANIEKVDTDATSAENLKNQYNGTGLSGDTYPATQASVANIGSGTAGAINYKADTDNTGGAIKGASFVGNVTSGTLANTAVEDGVSYTFEDTANVIDVVLGFDVGGSNQGVEVEVVANVDGNADEMLIKAYDFDGAGWDTIGTLVGSGGTAYTRLNLSLLGRNTGSGADVGKVYIRFDTDTTTPSLLQIDKCIVGAVTTNRSVGYSSGSVWVNTSTGTSGVESFVNGVADNPVDSYANALTIASNVGLNRYTFTAGDNITLTQSHATDDFFGYNYQVAMANQSPPTYIEGAEITGICNGSAAHYVRDCRIGTISTALTLNQGAIFVNSGLVNVALKDAASAALDVEFLDCHGNTQGSMFPGGTVDFGTTAGTNHEVSFQRWGGPVTIKNLKDGDVVYAHGNGTFILDSSCTGGSFRVAGMINLVDNSAGAVSILQDGRITRSGIADEVWKGLLMADTTIATLTSQTSFTLTDGSADDDAYNGCTIMIVDDATETQKAVGIVSDYTGSTKTVTLVSDPGVFTMAATDKAYILAPNTVTGTKNTLDSLNDLSAAQVNSEVLDVLTTDTFAEPGSVPAATSSLKDKIGWLFMLARNKLTQTSTTAAVRDDGDTTDVATSSVSDNGTTFTRGEYS